MKSGKRRTAVILSFAAVVVAWLLFPLLPLIQPARFNASGWQGLHHHFNGGQGWSIAPAGDLTRLGMVEELQHRHLRVGMRRPQVLQLLGAPEASGAGTHDQEDVYNLVDRPGALAEILAVRRWGTREPALYVKYVDGAVARASVR